VSNSYEANVLLNKYIFKIVPMVNVDGVLYGNSRCDISGSDINRQWNFPSEILNPTVFACKEMFTRLVADGCEIDYFLDLHGHSKKYFYIY
jgi:murein tripeptide amidase MpaA